MKKLFIIDGAAGTGKSEFISYVNSKYPNSANVIQKKMTTRQKREGEDEKKLDLLFVTEEEFEKGKNVGDVYDYRYGEPAVRYGIRKQDLEDSILSYEFTCVIVRNLDVINTLVKDYATKARVIRIFVYTDEDKVIQWMREKGADKAAIQYRRDRIAETWRDFLEHPNPSRNTRILINNGSKQDYHRLINDLFVTYSDQNESREKLYISPNEIFPLLPPLIGYKDKIQSVLDENAYDRNVFVMMRFREENESLYTYISDLLKSKGFNCIRSNLPPVKKITGNVYQPMAAVYCCKYGIALFDAVSKPDRRLVFSPNVAYELGMMQAQCKKCVILKHRSLKKDKFFDILKDSAGSTIVYNKDTELKKPVLEWVDAIIKDSEDLE